MKRVLVTGASGFLGTPAVEALSRRGFEVHAVSRWPQASEAATWHAADLLAPGRPRQIVESVQPTHLLHLAWYAEPGQFWTSPENARWVRASLELARAFAESGGERMVAAGTCAEYDWFQNDFVERQTPLAPSTPYGRAKVEVSLSTQEIAEDRGVSLAWGRVFFMFGPREHPSRLVSSVIRSLLTGQAAACTDGSQIRDFLYVDDVADAFATLLESSVEGPVNVARGAGIRIRDLLRLVGEVAGAGDLIHYGALEMPKHEPTRLIADVRRLSEEVGWHPSFSLDDAVARTVAWWSDRLSRVSD